MRRGCLLSYCIVLAFHQSIPVELPVPKSEHFGHQVEERNPESVLTDHNFGFAALLCLNTQGGSYHRYDPELGWHGGGAEGVGRVRPSVMLPPTPMHPPP